MALLDSRLVPWLPGDHLSGLPTELKHDIIRRCPIRTLSCLAQVSRLFYEVVTPILYERDANDAKPRAIFWAASARSTEATEKTITKVLDLAKHCGGDVNRMYDYCGESGDIAPLHMAASRGNIAAARRLLELGAEVNSSGWTLFTPSFQSELADHTMRHAVSGGQWRPLFVPFFNQNEEMIRLLLRFGASPVVLIPRDNPRATAHDLSTINILHLLSANPRANMRDEANRSYFKRFAELIDVPIQLGSTPLFLALRHHNQRAFRLLMASGANVELLNEFGRSLLTQTITYRFTSKDAQARQWYNDIAEDLIKSHKAKISGYGPHEAFETPLTCAIKAISQVPDEYKRPLPDIEAMVNLLLGHGANINERSNEGMTILHALSNIILREKDSDRLRQTFNDLVSKGADLTMPYRNGRSVLGTCILRFNQRPPKFLKLLLELHAPLMPQEVDDVFIQWTQSSSLRKSLNADVQRYLGRVSQNAIDAVYATVLGKDETFFKQLKEHFPRTTIAERFAAATLLDNESHLKWFDLALEMKDFDGSYIHHGSGGNGLLHCIVQRLHKTSKYRDLDARDDARKVLLLGAIPSHRDALGRTALEVLRGFGKERDCPVLRLYLYDVTARWNQLMAGRAPETLKEPNVREQWLKMLEDDTL